MEIERQTEKESKVKAKKKKVSEMNMKQDRVLNNVREEAFQHPAEMTNPQNEKALNEKATQIP